jgi:hypothetical protein
MTVAGGKSAAAGAPTGEAPEWKMRPGRGAWTQVIPLFVFAMLCAFTSIARETLTILPEHVSLHGPTTRQQLVVERIEDRQSIGQITNVTFTSSDPNVVRIQGNVALPVGNGRAKVQATIAGRSISAKVTVTGMDDSPAWSFRNHVQPVMAKFGCSAGACHVARLR